MKIKFRHVYMTLGSILVLLALFACDPDVGFISDLPYGASTVASIVILAKVVLYVAVLYLSRRALVDYIDMEEVYKKAMSTPSGAGYIFIGISLMMIAVSIITIAAVSIN